MPDQQVQPRILGAELRQDLKQRQARHQRGEDERRKQKPFYCRQPEKISANQREGSRNAE